MKKDQLFDRPIPADYAEEWRQRVAMPKVEFDRGSVSVLIFRIESEWLTLDSRIVQEIAEVGHIHKLPRNRSRIVLGVTNVRSRLVVCVSLAEFLHLGGDRRPFLKVVVLEDGGHRLAVPVHEVYGIHRYHASDAQVVTAKLAETRYTTAILSWNEKSAACLDTAALMAGIRKSLS